MNLLDSSPVCVLTDKEFLPKEGMTFATQVAQFFEGQGGIANSPFGTVVLDKKGVQNSKQHGNSRIKSASFAAVKDVLEKGVVIKPLDYYGTNDKKQMTGMIAAPIQIADEKYVCVVVVIANTELQRLYVHESFLTKNLQEVAASNLVPRSNTSSPQPYGEVAKVLHNFLISKQNEKNNAEDTENNIKTENRQYKMKQRIRLTEGDLHRIIRKCVNEALEKPFRTAETVGPFVNNRAQFLNLRTKKEQMDSDWADLRHSGAYPYGDGPNQPDGWCPKGDYVESDDDRENGDYPSNPNILNRRFWESRQRKRNAGLTEAKLHKIIKKVLREDSGNYEYMEHYYAELFHRDGDIVDCEEFDMDNLKGAIKWAKAQAAAHPDLVSEVFYIDEHGDMEETGYYYGDWSV